MPYFHATWYCKIAAGVQKQKTLFKRLLVNYASSIPEWVTNGYKKKDHQYVPETAYHVVSLTCLYFLPVPHSCTQKVSRNDLEKPQHAWVNVSLEMFLGRTRDLLSVPRRHSYVPLVVLSREPGKIHAPSEYISSCQWNVSMLPQWKTSWNWGY